MRSLISRSVVALVAVVAVGCNSLDITNPNAPDTERALKSPTAIASIAGGTIRTFFNTYNGLEATGPLTAQAESHTASWNNFNMNFYSSLDLDNTRNNRGWQNDPFLTGRTSVQWFWQGYYSVASSARDVLYAIRVDSIEFDDPAESARAEAVAELMLGAALGQIALNYDKGYFFDETSDLATVAYVDRRVLRDSAVAHLQSAAALAAATTFDLPTAWTNNAAGYDNLTLVELANSLAAMTLAYWPRNDAENAAVDWAEVVSFAEDGLTSDFVIVGDGCASFCPEMQSWTNDVYGIRVHTRVAALLDPATQVHPYDDANYGSPPPNSPDARLGDGSFGTAEMADPNDLDYGTIELTANAGTDFAWIGYEAFNPVRGQYHQSNIAHIRYDASGEQDLNSIYSGYGPVPLMMAAQNDLIHAEALVRSGGDLNLAATLINGTRVGRGNLSPAAAGGDGGPQLLLYIEYENEIELLSQGASVFWNRRRSPAGLRTGTPREMPVPARELGVKLEPLYTFGGATPQSPLPTP